MSVLLKDGHAVLNVSRNDSEEKHVNLSYHSLDVLKQDWDGLPALQEIHGLAYCPGSIDLKPLRRVSVDDMKEAMDVNLYGALKAIQWAYPVMRKTPNAAVVLFSTVAVSQGMPFHTVVASAKGAVEGFTKSLAAEFGYSTAALASRLRKRHCRCISIYSTAYRVGEVPTNTDRQTQH